jgi:hypothetical protein
MGRANSARDNSRAVDFLGFVDGFCAVVHSKKVVKVVMFLRLTCITCHQMQVYCNSKSVSYEFGLLLQLVCIGNRFAIDPRRPTAQRGRRNRHDDFFER